MTVYLDPRRSVWKFDFYRHGIRHVGDCRHADGRPAANRSEARRIEEGHKAAANNRPAQRIGTPHGYSMAQAALAYLGTLAGRASERDARRHIQELLDSRQFAPARLVTDISDQDVLDFIAAARQRPRRVWIGGPQGAKPARASEKPGRASEKAGAGQRSNATLNRLLGSLRGLLRLAHRMRDPQTGRRLLPDLPLIPQLRELARQPRPVPDEIIERICDHAEPHLVRAIFLMRATGMRLDEALTARASQCDFHAGIYWLPAEATKSGRAEAMPLDAAALPIIAEMAATARAAGQDHLILYTPPARRRPAHSGEAEPARPQPRPVASLKTAWAAAQRRAGITPHYRLHDLRASFITAIAMVASDRVVQSLARHISGATTARYIKVVDAARRAAVEAAPRPRLRALAGSGNHRSPTPVSHPEPEPQPEKVIKLLK